MRGEIGLDVFEVLFEKDLLEEKLFAVNGLILELPLVVHEDELKKWAFIDRLLHLNYVEYVVSGLKNSRVPIH